MVIQAPFRGGDKWRSLPLFAAVLQRQLRSHRKYRRRAGRMHPDRWPDARPVTAGGSIMRNQDRQLRLSMRRRRGRQATPTVPSRYTRRHCAPAARLWPTMMMVSTRMIFPDRGVGWSSGPERLEQPRDEMARANMAQTMAGGGDLE